MLLDTALKFVLHNKTIVEKNCNGFVLQHGKEVSKINSIICLYN